MIMSDMEFATYKSVMDALARHADRVDGGRLYTASSIIALTQAIIDISSMTSAPVAMRKQASKHLISFEAQQRAERLGREWREHVSKGPIA